MTGGLLLLGLAACSQPDPAEATATRTLRGSVFLRADDGQAVKLALARVYLLTEADRLAMAEAERAIRRKHEPAIAAARAELDQAAQYSTAEEERALALLTDKNETIAKLEKSGASEEAIQPFRFDQTVARAAYSKIRLQNLKTMEPALLALNKAAEQAQREIGAAKTAPPRALAEAAVTDAEGSFSVAIPQDCDSLLVEAEAQGARLVWLIPVATLDFSKVYLLSEHNLQH